MHTSPLANLGSERNSGKQTYNPTIPRKAQASMAVCNGFHAFLSAFFLQKQFLICGFLTICFVEKH